MKFLTMVARGALSDGANKQYCYTLVDSDFKIYNLKEQELAKVIKAGQIEVTNLSIVGGEIRATNGAMDKYTQFDVQGNVVGKPRAVILSRIEKNGDLVGYIVFTPDGVVSKIPLEKVVEMCKNELIANGKLRPVGNGYIVSSIKGEYPIENHKMSKEPISEVPTIEATLFGSALKGSNDTRFVGMEVKFSNAVNMSKLYPTLKEANISVCTKLRDEYGYDKSELVPFKMRQTIGAGIYGVYPMSMALKLANGAFKLNEAGIFIIGCDDRTKGTHDEAMCIYKRNGGKMEEIDRQASKSKNANSYLEQYRDDCVKKLG